MLPNALNVSDDLKVSKESRVSGEDGSPCSPNAATLMDAADVADVSGGSKLSALPVTPGSSDTTGVADATDSSGMDDVSSLRSALGSPVAPRKMWSLHFVQLLAIEGVFQFGTYLLNPIITGYVLLLGASLAAGGFVAGLVATSSLVARPFTGMVADRLSKSTLLVLSAVLFTVAAFGCAFAVDVFWLSVFRFVQGVAFAFRSAVVISLVSLTVPHDHVGRAVGWVGVMTMVSSAVAPSISSLIGASFSYRICFLLAGSLFACGLAIAVWFKVSSGMHPRASSKVSFGALSKKLATSRNARNVVSDAAPVAVPNSASAIAPGEKPNAGSNKKSGVGSSSKVCLSVRDFIYVPSIPYSVMAALSGAPHAINASLILTVGEYRSIAGISLYFAFYAAATLVARPVVGKLCDTRGFGFVAVPVLAIDLAGVLFLVCMNSLAMVAVAGVLVGIGQGSAYSALQAETVRNVHAEELGRASNTFYIGPDINMGVTPFVAGFVMQYWGVTATYCVCFALVFFALVLAFFMKGHVVRPKKNE